MTDAEALSAAMQRAAAASSVIQGEVLAIADASVVLADAAAPLSRRALEVARQEQLASGLIVVPHPVDQVAVLTQTCDLQLTTTDEYLCLVAPVMQVGQRAAHEAVRGRRPSLAGLPWVDDESAVDLSRITTIERSVLLLSGRSRGRPRTPRERMQFAEAISRYLTRPALPDPVNTVLSPFVRRIAEKHDRDSPEGRCAHHVSEIRLEAAPDLDATAPALNVLMILEQAILPGLPVGHSVDEGRIDDLRRQGLHAAAQAVESANQPVATREAWMALAECWLQPAVDRLAEVEAVGSIEITVLNATELSYARSLGAPLLDVRYLSLREP